MTIYYRDVIERDDLIINEETLLYLVPGSNPNEFSLKAIKKIHLEKIPFDPYTRSIQYWPVDLKYLFAIENDDEALSKIFYYEHDSKRLVLSMGSLTRIEVNALLKIDPISENDVSTSEEKISVTPVLSISFNSDESNKEEFISFIKISVIFEGQELFDRLRQLMQSAQLVHALCDAAKSHEKLPFIFTLGLIKKECASIREKIDVLGITICVFIELYPNLMNEGDTDFLVDVRGFASIICDTIDKISVQYLKNISNYASDSDSDSHLSDVLPVSPQIVEPNIHREEIIRHELSTQQQNNAEESSQTNIGFDCINTIANHCITFFKKMTLTTPTHEVSYPYNRTRIHL